MSKVTQLASSLGNLALGHVLKYYTMLLLREGPWALPLEWGSVGVRWYPGIHTLNKFPNDWMDSSVGKQCSRGRPKKTLWRAKAGKALVRLHTWKEELGKVRENWVLIKMKGKEK